MSRILPPYAKRTPKDDLKGQGEWARNALFCTSSSRKCQKKISSRPSDLVLINPSSLERKKELGLINVCMLQILRNHVEMKLILCPIYILVNQVLGLNKFKNILQKLYQIKIIYKHVRLSYEKILQN